MPIIRSPLWNDLFNIVKFNKTSDNDVAQESVIYLSYFVDLSHVSQFEFGSTFDTSRWKDVQFILQSCPNVINLKIERDNALHAMNVMNGQKVDDSLVEVTSAKSVDKNQYFRFIRNVTHLIIAANLPFLLPTSAVGPGTTTIDFASHLTAISNLMIRRRSLIANSTLISTIVASVINGATAVSLVIFRLNFMANINFEYFKKFKYDAVQNGDLCCPVCGDKETFQTSGSMDGLPLEETKMVWNHVHEAHSIDFDRIYNKLQSSCTFIPRESVLSQAMQLVGACNARINEAISLWALATLEKQEVLAAIEKEHKELEKKLGELF